MLVTSQWIDRDDCMIFQRYEVQLVGKGGRGGIVG